MESIFPRPCEKLQAGSQGSLVAVIPIYEGFKALFLPLGKNGAIIYSPILIDSDQSKSVITINSIIKRYFKRLYNFMPDKFINSPDTITFRPEVNITFSLVICLIDRQQRDTMGKRFVEITLSEAILMRETNIFYDLLIMCLGDNLDKLIKQQNS